MADQRININIGSSYNGAGMTKALGAVNTMGNQAKKAAGAVGQLAGAFDGLGGTAAKSIGAITNGLTAIATGGIIGGVVAVISTVVGAWQEHNAKLKEAKEKTEQLAAAKEKMVNEAMANVKHELEEQIALFDKLLGKWNAYAASVSNVSKSWDKLAASASSLEESQLIGDINAQIANAKDKDERDRIKARGAVQLAELRGQAKVTQASSSVKGAEETVKNLTATKGLAQGEVDKAKSIKKAESGALEQLMDLYKDEYKLFDRIRRTEEQYGKAAAQEEYDKYFGEGGTPNLETGEKLSKKGYDKIAQQVGVVQAASEAEKKAEDRVKDLDRQLEAANNRLTAATLDLTTARQQARNSVDEAKQAERELIAAQKEEADRQKEAADKQKRENTLKEERIRLTKQLNELQSKSAKDQKAIDEQIKKAKEDLKTAIQNAEQAFANAHINLNAVYNGAVGGTPAGGATGDAEKDNKTARRQAKGMSSSTDWGTGRAFNPDKAARYMESHGKEFGGFSQKEKRDYQDLLDKEKRGSLGAKGRQRLRDYRARDPKLKEQKAAKEAAAAAKKLKDLQQQKETAQQQAYTDIGEIKKKLENLGLK